MVALVWLGASPAFARTAPVARVVATAFLALLAAQGFLVGSHADSREASTGLRDWARKAHGWSAWYQRCSAIGITAIATLLVVVLALAAYMSAYPRLPQALGGLRPREAILDLHPDKVARGTVFALTGT